MEIVAEVEANKETCSTGSQTRNSAINIELLLLKTGQTPQMSLFLIWYIYHLRTAIMQFVHIVNCWLSSSVFVIFGFVHVLVEIDQAFAW